MHGLLRTSLCLRDVGHTVLIINYHPDVIATADHLITLGSGGGQNGGRLVL